MAKRITTVESPLPPPDLESMIDLAGIARVFGVGRRTVERWRAGGMLPPPDLAVGRVKRWRPSTVARWLEERTLG